MLRAAIVAVVLPIGFLACSPGAGPSELDRSLGPTSDTSTLDTPEPSLTMSSTTVVETTILNAATTGKSPQARFDDLYEDCLLGMGFDPGGVQVLIDGTGRPWWVKTGNDVPADLHEPCLAQIGGEPNGLSSWGLPGPADDCVALIGSEPWIALFTETLTPGCVIVAEGQNIQVWNKGFSPLTVEWFDGPRRLSPDEHFETGTIESVLSPGPNTVESSPYPMPIIWLLPTEASPSAGLRSREDSFDPLIGMTLGEASEQLGLPIEIDPNLLGGPDCLGAVVVDDPYSPLFVVLAENVQPDSKILSIHDGREGPLLVEDPCP